MQELAAAAISKSDQFLQQRRTALINGHQFLLNRFLRMSEYTGSVYREISSDNWFITSQNKLPLNRYILTL